MSKPNEKVEAIFEAALALETDAHRVEYLNRACPDGVLRREVESLLAAHQNPDSVFEEATVLVQTPLSEGPGTRIGRYKLLQQIGEGGMGVVYMAEQEEPVRRRVALKIIKLGMDTKQVVARFEAERQALAIMDHPNIAKVLDGGATDTGRPYFVMELVQGVPITEFCDKARLPAKERLKLFMQVCQAIQSAHQKGIIHRDIKPSNVLVTLHDGVPVPKVIDFGIAKATNQKLTEKTLFTNFATMIGTPAYMSPEQAEMSGLDIDTRTDIYALGVLLYALLTGTTPFPEKRLRSLGYGEMQRVILEEEPERPSTRLSTMANEEKTIVARNCGEELTALSNLLKGDLDWIVMKCLEKDRQRRYETANGLASDIQRHLSNEPVIARPPSVAYQFQKMVRRNKLAFAAAAGITSVLVLGVAASTWQAIRATKAERQQSTLRRDAETARGAEAKQRTLAEQRVYDSLVREARALRLARRVGYRDKVFSLLQQAVAIEGAQKDFGELRREAVACLGDFVGASPITYTNFLPGFELVRASLSPSGRLAAFGFWSREQGKAGLIIRAIPSGEDLIKVVTDKSIAAIDFLEPDRFGAIFVPDEAGNGRNERYARAEIVIWATARDGTWREVSREPMPHAYDFVPAVPRPMIAVDDWPAGVVRLVDLDTRTIRHQITVSKAMRKFPKFIVSNGGKFLAIQTAASPEDAKPEAEVWNLELGTQVRTCTLGKDEIVSGISADGKHLATLLGELNSAVVYDLNTMNALAHFRDFMSAGGAKGPGMAPGQNIVALASVLRRDLGLVDYARQEVIASLDQPSTTFDVRFSMDGRWMLTAGLDFARVYELSGGKEVMGIKADPAEGANAAFHPSGSHIATVGFDDSLTLWSSVSGRVVLRKAFVPIEGIRFSPNGELLLVGSYGTQEVLLADGDTGEILLKLGASDRGSVQSVVLSQDNRYLVAASRRIEAVDGEILNSDDPSLGSVSVWELQYSRTPQKAITAKLLQTLPGKYSSLAFLPLSSRVVFYDFKIKPAAFVWDVTSTNAPQKLSATPRWDFENFSPTPDGRGVWMVDAEGRVVCVEIATGKHLAVLSDGSGRRETLGTCNISLSPDGSRLAVPSMKDLSVEIFDTVAGRSLYNLPGRAGSPWGSGWSSDSQRLLVSRSNGDVSVWNLAEVDRTLAGLGLAKTDSPTASKP